MKSAAIRSGLRVELQAMVRQRILDAAAIVFLDRGVASVTVEDLLVAAGVSRGTFYAYFTGKRDVAFALLADTFDQADALYRDFATLGDWSYRSIRTWLQRVDDVWRADEVKLRMLLRDMASDMMMVAPARRQTRVAAMIGESRLWASIPREDAERRAGLIIYQIERTFTATHIEGWATDRAALLDLMAESMRALLAFEN